MSTLEWTLSDWNCSDRDDDGVGAPVTGITDGTPQACEEFVKQTQGIDEAAETVPLQHDRHRDYRRSYHNTRGATSRIIDGRATNNPAPTSSTARREPRRDACTTSDQDHNGGHDDGSVSLTATTQAFDAPGESQSLHSSYHNRHMEPRRTRSKMQHQNTVASGDERLPQRDGYFTEEELRPLPLGDTVALEDVARDCVSPLPAVEEQHHAPRQDNGLTSKNNQDTSPVPVLLAAGDHAQDGRFEVVKAIAPCKEDVCVNWDDARGKEKQLLQQQPPKTDHVDGIGNRAPESDADAGADAHGHLRATGNGVNIRKVVVAEQEATAFSLVDAVQAALGVSRPSSSLLDGVDNDEDLGCTRHTPFWCLTIQRCQLFYLVPTTRLLHLMRRMCGMDIVECTGLVLTGLEHILIDANCLRTLTIRRCGLTRLPQLRSGSVEVLDLSENCIKSTAGLETLFRLKRLNLASNSIRNVMGLRPLIPLGTGCLRELNLHGNPVQETTRYRPVIEAMIPSIQVLDGVTVSRRRSGKIPAGMSTSKPKVDWTQRLRLLEEQGELLPGNCAKAQSARRSRSRQIASTERLSQPLRRLLLKENVGHSNYSSCPCCSNKPEFDTTSLFADQRASQVGDSSTVSTIKATTLAESLALVNRPTAFKGPDGKWEGVTVVVTKAAKKKALRSKPTTASPPLPDPAAASAVSTDAWCWRTAPCPRSHSDPRLLQRSLQYPQASPQDPSSPSYGPSNIPARATMMLPDSWSTNQSSPSARAPRRRPTTGAGHNIADGHGTTFSSPRAGRRCAVRRQRIQRGATPSVEAEMCRPAKGFCGFQTPMDFADTIRRAFKVELDQEEARSLYHQLDSDRDGVLGAEDLLRGAPIIAKLRMDSQHHPGRDDDHSPQRQGRQVQTEVVPVNAERTRNRYSARIRQSRTFEQMQTQLRRGSRRWEQRDYISRQPKRGPQRHGHNTRIRSRASHHHGLHDTLVEENNDDGCQVDASPMHLDGLDESDCIANSLEDWYLRPFFSHSRPTK